jgi:hypothetical protein
MARVVLSAAAMTMPRQVFLGAVYMLMRIVYGVHVDPPLTIPAAS